MPDDMKRSALTELMPFELNRNRTTTTALPNIWPSQIDPYVDVLTANRVTQAVYCYALPVLVVVGTVGNILSLVVLCADKKKDTTNISLTFLAVSDTGYIVTTFVRQTSCIMGHFDAVLARNFSTLMYGQMIVVNICFARITGLVTAVISSERCLAVIMPLRVRGLVTRQRVLICLGMVYVATFVLIGPVFFMGESQWVTTNTGDANVTHVRYSYTQWYMDNKQFADNYRDIFLNISFRFIPTSVICFNTAAIIIRLKKASAWRGDTLSSSSRNTRSSTKENKLTVMLVSLCVMFILCTLPGVVFQVCTYLSPEFTVFGRYNNTYKMTSAISLLAQFINSSINFILYMALNERFATTFQQIFSCTRVKSKKNES